MLKLLELEKWAGLKERKVKQTKIEWQNNLNAAATSRVLVNTNTIHLKLQLSRSTQGQTEETQSILHQMENSLCATSLMNTEFVVAVFALVTAMKELLHILKFVLVSPVQISSAVVI